MRAVIALSVVPALVVPLGAQRLTPAQRARAGWDALNAGRPQAAAAAFEEALRDAPREPALLLGAALPRICSDGPMPRAAISSTR